MQRASSSSSSSSLISQSTHDVFLSFRGIDTRTSFTYNLYHALKREKINTFFDDRELKRGENISAALLQAIEDSKISVVIISENYASSSWCLEELVKILECQETKQQIVIPVFYKVHPTNVRSQSGKFGEAFVGLKHKQDKIPKWKEALTEVANLAGWPYTDGYEYDFIEKIVEEIKRLHQSNKMDQKKNINGADLYNQAVFAAAQQNPYCTDVHSGRSSNEAESKLSGEELYNLAILDYQRKRPHLSDLMKLVNGDL